MLERGRRGDMFVIGRVAGRKRREGGERGIANLSIMEEKKEKD